MLTLDRVTFAYGDNTILSDASLTLPKRGAVCFTAPSGGGKTTLLRLFAGLETPQSGRVLCDAQRIAMVFQEHRLLPWLTVRQNVEVACPDTDVMPFLEAVELDDVADSYPAKLSGGMQRRVAIARALAFGGDLLLLDEPFSGLDDALKARVATAISQRFHDALIVLISHDPEDAALLDATVLPLTFPLQGQLESTVV